MKAATNIPFYCSLYPRLCEIGRGMGYAICIHGSLQRDMDVIAVPWIESPSDPVELVTAIASAIDGEMPHAGKPNGNGGFDAVDLRIPVSKPHGRVVWTICLKDGMFVDFGVIVPQGWELKPASAVPRHIKSQGDNGSNAGDSDDSD